MSFDDKNTKAEDKMLYYKETDTAIYYKGKKLMEFNSLASSIKYKPSIYDVEKYDIDVLFKNIDSVDIPIFLEKLKDFVDKNKDILSETEVS